MIHLLQQHDFFIDKTIDSCQCLEQQGYCNENYVIVSEGKKYIARKLVRDDIDRKFEYSIQKAAYRICIAAEPLILDEKNNLMIAEFLEGKHKRKLNIEDLKNLAHVLRKLHSIECNKMPIDIEIKNKTDEVVNAFQTITSYPEEHVLCHNDLNPQNIFFSDEIKFIDFEYAGVNDRYFDLACICVEFDLDEAGEKYFLTQYSEENIYNQKKLEAYKTIYIALCKQWFENN
jgi:aminoglycoside phosphotransferase (APT) family kinase protein